MKTRFGHSLTAKSIILLILMISFVSAQQIPEKINFQGKLFDSNGKPINGTKTMIFKIGNWLKSYNVAIDSGLYSVVLEVPPDSMKSEDVTISLKIDGSDLSSPTEILSVPYSYFSKYANESGNADKLNGQDSAYYLQTLKIDGHKISISNGNEISLPTTSVSEVDPLFSRSPAYDITNAIKSNWDKAYGWGDHSKAGYLTIATFESHSAAKVTDRRVSNWDSAYIWGNHNTKGYLTSETDPVFNASVAKSVVTADTNHWNTTWRWGNHGDQPYIKSSNLSDGYLPYWQNSTKTAQNSNLFNSGQLTRIGPAPASQLGLLSINSSIDNHALRTVHSGTGGGAAYFSVESATNSNPAVTVLTSGAGSAAQFSNTNNTNANPCVQISQGGAGKALLVTGNNTMNAIESSNLGTAISGTSSSGGYGVYGLSSGSSGGYFKTNNTDANALVSDGKFYCNSNCIIDGKTGIGVTNPTNGKLEVSSTTTAIYGIANGTGYGVHGLSTGSFGGYFKTNNSASYALVSDGKFNCKNNCIIDGNAGIGVTNPTNGKLEVSGTATAIYGLANGTGYGVHGLSTGSYGGYFKTNNSASYALVSDGRLYCNNNFIIDGNIGVGVTNPTNGKIQISSTGTSIYAQCTSNSYAVHGISSTNSAGFFRTSSTSVAALVGENANGSGYLGLNIIGRSYLYGNVGINSAPSSTYSLIVSGNVNVSGNVIASCGTLSCASDSTLKTSFEKISNPLSMVLKLNGLFFKWKDSKLFDSKRHIGLLAQEVKNVLPEVVYFENNIYTLDYSSISALLIESIKELSAKNVNLAKENEELKNKFDLLQARIEKMEDKMNGLSSKGK